MTDRVGNMPDDAEQCALLRDLTLGGGYGTLFIIRSRGDVVFAASPVPQLNGYEIVCASPERVYDIWKNGKLVKPNQTREQIREWIRKHTPKWLYDDTEPTKDQKTQVAEWVGKFRSRYPGTMALG